MNEDKMQQDSDVRVQHIKIFREFGGFLLYKKAGNVGRDIADLDDVPLDFQIHQAFTVYRFTETDDSFNRFINCIHKRCLLFWGHVHYSWT